MRNGKTHTTEGGVGLGKLSIYPKASDFFKTRNQNKYKTRLNFRVVLRRGVVQHSCQECCTAPLLFTPQKFRRKTIYKAFGKHDFMKENQHLWTSDHAKFCQSPKKQNFI
jgi:hypothetical protein